MTALVDFSIIILTLLTIFAIRVAVIHASAKFLLPPSRDISLFDAIHLAGIGVILAILPIAFLEAILFIAYAARIYDESRLFGLAIASIAWVAGFVMKIAIEALGTMV